MAGPKRDHDGLSRRPDAGVTYVELLVSIVLIGTAVVASLVAVRTTLIASTIDAERSEARTWLVEAADRIRVAGPLPCTGTNADAIEASYDAIAVDQTLRPADWDTGSIDVMTVEFMSRPDADAGYQFGGDCLDTAVEPDDPHHAQLVTLRVVTPGGEIETMQVVLS